MIEKKYFDLINQEIDCHNSPKQSEKLKAYLKHNSEANQFYNDLSDLSKRLSEVGKIDPPQNLKKNILNSIPFDAYATQKKRFTFKRYLDIFLFGSRPRYAYVFSAGIVIGILAISLLIIFVSKKDSIHIADLYGTIGASNKLNIAYETKINEDFGSGDIRLLYSNKEILLDASFSTTQNIGILLEFNTSDLNFLGLKTSNNRDKAHKVNNNKIQFTNQGENHYLLTFGRKTSMMTLMFLKISSPDGVIREYQLMSEPGSE